MPYACTSIWKHESPLRTHSRAHRQSPALRGVYSVKVRRPLTLYCRFLQSRCGIQWKSQGSHMYSDHPIGVCTKEALCQCIVMANLDMQFSARLCKSQSAVLANVTLV